MNFLPRVWWNIAAIVVIIAGLSFLVSRGVPSSGEALPAQSAATSLAASSSVTTAASSSIDTLIHVDIKKASSTVVKATPKPVPTPTAPARQTSPPVPASSSDQVSRIQNPYSFPSEPADQINSQTRAALVNIICMTHGGSVKPISGSGVMIDPRGIILTNAHVAQYVLLSESPEINLTCNIRSGSPAHTIGQASVLYIPPVWVATHASELNTEGVRSTGEHDYGLLIMNPGSGIFPSLPYDTRDAIGFSGDQVLVAGYPAEFLGGLAAENNLFAATSVGTIGTLFTFSDASVDAISLGSVIEAQSGSSGGAVVNAWGRLIGIITTTSEGATTADRDLHAITLAHINTDMRQQTGSVGLTELLASDLTTAANSFNANVAPSLLQEYLTVLKKNH